MAVPTAGVAERDSVLISGEVGRVRGGGGVVGARVEHLASGANFYHAGIQYEQMTAYFTDKYMHILNKA